MIQMMITNPKLKRTPQAQIYSQVLMKKKSQTKEREIQNLHQQIIRNQKKVKNKRKEKL
jgi:hypothetical protein